MAKNNKIIATADNSTRVEAHTVPNKANQPFPGARPDPKNLMDPKEGQVIQKRHEFTSIAEQIAESHIAVGNYRIPSDKKLFPLDQDAAKRFVSRFFPYAKGGALFVDEPANEHELQFAEKRQKFLHGLGHRHVIVPRTTSPETLYNCMEQLKGVKNVDDSSNRSQKSA